MTLLIVGLASRLWATTPAELERFVHVALAAHPRVVEAEARARQAIESYHEIYEFFDLGVRVAGGASERMRSVPGLETLGSLSSEAFEVQGSLQIPFRPGAYVTLGLTERYLRNPDGYDGLYQSVAGLAVRIPLLRDRGFNTWDLRRRQMLAEVEQALCDVLAERQRLRHEVEIAYISVLETAVLSDISRRATLRFESLLSEAESLVEHDAIAEYQIYAAKTELELGRAADLHALEAFETNLLLLMELIAVDYPPEVAVEAENWLERAVELELADAPPAGESPRHRGDYLAVVNERLAAEWAQEREREALRGDLSLEAGATWRVDDEHRPFAHSAGEGDSPFGSHVMLLYERPLGYRGERSRLARQYARMAELDARLHRLQRVIRRDVETSRTRFEYARKRLVEVARAVDSAGKNLAAEEERFLLGESRSRIVLDAQKDRTATERAHVAAAASVLRAWSDYRYATGYPVAPDER